MIKARHVAGCLLLLAICLGMLAAALRPVNAGEAERKTLKHRWTIDAAYPQFGDDKIDAAIREWLESTITDIMEQSKGEAITMRTEAFNENGIDYKEFQPSDDAVSVAFTVFTYPSGAAHPMTAITTRNYLRGSGKPLTLDDTFAKPDLALEILSQHAKANVKAYLKKNYPDAFENDDYSMLDEDWFMDGTAPTRDNYDTLVLEPGGVRVYFQLYQVLPYVFGLVNYFVPVEDLEAAGPNGKIWPHPKG